MGLNKRDDLFMLQIRLFRMAQLKWDKSVADCERIFKEYAVNEYIETCYEEYHVQGDETNFADLERYLKAKGLSVNQRESRLMKLSKYEYTMQLLAKMVSINIARQQKISRTKAFLNS